MAKYAVQAKIQFIGVTSVEAENAHEACRIAEELMALTRWKAMDDLDVDVLDIDEEKKWVKVSE